MIYFFLTLNKFKIKKSWREVPSSTLVSRELRLACVGIKFNSIK